MFRKTEVKKDNSNNNQNDIPDNDIPDFIRFEDKNRKKTGTDEDRRNTPDPDNG